MQATLARVVARNVTVTVAGVYLMWQVFAAALETRAVFMLDSGLDAARAAAGSGDYVAAAMGAAQILGREPRSLRAQMYVICYSWAAWDRDLAASMIQKGPPDITPDNFRSCGSAVPLSDALDVARYTDTTARQVFVVDEVSPHTKPTVAEVRAAGTAAVLVWTGLACRNLHSGLPELAGIQTSVLVSSGFNISDEVRRLPAAWGCDDLVELK